MASARRWYFKKRFLIPCVLFVAMAVVLGLAYHEPSEIPLQADRVWGMACLRARDLVIQGHDVHGDVWATRGLWAYRRRSGEPRFVRQFHIPTGFNRYWLMNLSFVRGWTRRVECAEMLTLPDGAVCAVSGGYIWHRPADGGRFVKVLTLRHYGMGVGRGVLPSGLAALADGTVLLGEYFRNDERGSVRVYAGKKGGSEWEVAHEFPPGKVRHVHAIQQDPYGGKVWICTGDEDTEPMIAWTTATAEALHPIGSGSQMWRACQLAFARDALYWGADTGSNSGMRGIYRWDRTRNVVSKLSDATATILYATVLSDGTIVFSSDRESRDVEQDDRTKLWVSMDGRSATAIPCGERVTRGSTGSTSAYARFAYIRLERTQGSKDLYVTCYNVAGCHGDLLVIPSDEIRAMARRLGDQAITVEGAATQGSTRPATRPRND
ncbi:MAG: hypothetical protein JXQ73_25420 [Phycisphaerae bacterium]|nr:hypothetical protein [Phycisphaerae bacterium]